MSDTSSAESPKPAAKPALRPSVTRNAAAGDVIDIRQIIAVLRRRKHIIFGCMALITTFATIAVFQLTPRYTAEASVMLNTRKNQVMDFQSVLAGLPSDSTAIRSEVEILKSLAVARKVADKLDIYGLPEFNPGLKKASFFDAITSPVAWLKQSVRKLLAHTEARAVPAVEETEDIRKTAIARGLMGRVDVINDGRSYLLRIRAESESPELSAKIANTYVNVYLLSQLEAKFDAVRRATDWLNENLVDLRDKVRNSDRAVQLFKEQHDLTATRGGTVMTQQLSELNSQLIIASVDRAQKETSLRQLQDQLRSGNVDAAAVMGSPLIQKLREQENELLRRRAEMATRYKPAHPAMININAEITDVKRKLGEEINKTIRGMDGDVQAALAREASLRATLAGLQKSTAEQDTVAVQLRELEREAEANKTLYENFLSKFKQTSAQEDYQQADARLVSAATPPTVPSYPNKTMLVGFALVVSTFAGIALAFLIERLDNGFRTSDQIEKLLGFSTLGLVPGVTGRESPQDVVLSRPTSQYSEAIRSIRTALRYSDIDDPPKIVLVTSSLPSEGKTVFAASLARSVARSGARALLIDCDLRRPGIARVLGIEPEPHFLDLFEDGADQESLIRVDPASGIHYLPSKGHALNPQDVLGSQQLRSFLDRMRSRYDLIVIDSPPVLAVSDPIILSHIVDATIFLVRWEKTPRQIVTGALKLLRTNGRSIAGVVLSRINIRRHAVYGYGDAAYYYGHYSDYYARGDNRA